MGCSKHSSKREVYSNKILFQKTRKISNKQPNFTPEATTERRTNKTQSQQKERNQRQEKKTDERETKKTVEKINESKSWFFKKDKQN